MDSYYKCPNCGNAVFEVITKYITEYKTMHVEDTEEITYDNFDTIYEDAVIDEFICADCGETFEFEYEEDFLEYLAGENALKEQEKQMMEVEENNENLKKYIGGLQKEIDFLAQEIVTLKGRIENGN